MATIWQHRSARRRHRLNLSSIADALALPSPAGAPCTSAFDGATHGEATPSFGGRFASGKQATRSRQVSEELVGSRLGWISFDFAAALLCGTCSAVLGAEYGTSRHVAWMTSLSLANAFWLLLCGLFFACCVATLSRWSLFRHLQQTSGTAYEQLQILKIVALAALVARGVLTLMGSGAANRVTMESEILLTFWAMALARVCWRWRRLNWRRRGNSGRNFAIAGLTGEALQVRDYLSSLSYGGYSFKGFISLGESEVEGAIAAEHLIGSIESSISVARSMFVDEIFFMRRPKTSTLSQALAEARVAGIDVRLIPGIYETLQRRTDVHYIGDMPTIVLHQAGTQEVSRFFKRLFDVGCAIVVLMLSLPLFLALAVAIKLDSSGPVIYGSERVGLKGRIFRCFKFRTMVQNAHQQRSELKHLNERDGVLFKIANDPRITRMGRILRKYSLDELPQFWNVLRGDMSLVGPRPPIGDEVAQYQIDQFCRLEVMPGITGLWQVEARSDPSFESYIELDRKYVNDWSIWLDLKILLRTVMVVVKGTGS